MGSGTTGKLGRAWVGAWVGAWVVHGLMHGWWWWWCVDDVWWGGGGGKSICLREISTHFISFHLIYWNHSTSNQICIQYFLSPLSILHRFRHPRVYCGLLWIPKYQKWIFSPNLHWDVVAVWAPCFFGNCGARIFLSNIFWKTCCRSRSIPGPQSWVDSLHRMPEN